MADQLLTGNTLVETKTSNPGFWSCAGLHFQSYSPDVDDVNKDGPTGIFENHGAGAIDPNCTVDLPNGVEITSAVVYGNSATNWVLYRHLLTNGTTDTMAGAAIGTMDSTISYPIIDNTNYSYTFDCPTFAGTKLIYGAKITYR